MTAETEADRIGQRFGKTVRDLRTAAGLTQQGLAEALAAAGGPTLGHSAIAKVERGARDVRIGEAALLARILDVSLDDLLSGDGGRAAAAAELARIERDLEATRVATRAALSRRDALMDELAEQLGAEPVDLTRATPDWIREDRLADDETDEDGDR